MLLEQGGLAINSLGALLDETIAASALAPRGFELAATHGLTAYDATYLALGEARRFEVLTAEKPLVGLVRKVGLGEFVCFLE